VVASGKGKGGTIGIPPFTPLLRPRAMEETRERIDNPSSIRAVRRTLARLVLPLGPYSA